MGFILSQCISHTHQQTPLQTLNKRNQFNMYRLGKVLMPRTFIFRYLQLVPIFFIDFKNILLKQRASL